MLKYGCKGRAGLRFDIEVRCFTSNKVLSGSNKTIQIGVINNTDWCDKQYILV